MVGLDGYGVQGHSLPGLITSCYPLRKNPDAVRALGKGRMKSVRGGDWMSVRLGTWARGALATSET